MGVCDNHHREKHFNVNLHFIARRFLTDIQTDIKNVPVEDVSLVSKMAVLLM